MIQKIAIQNPENPLDEEFIELEVGLKTKILCREPYVKEAYSMYEKSCGNFKDFNDISDDSVFKGTIISVTDKAAEVELNKKYSTVIDMTKEKKEFLTYINPNTILDLKITKTRNQYNASFSNAIQDIKFKEIKESINKNNAYMAHVTELTNGGYFLVIDGVKVFMPGSLGGMNKLSNFEELVGKDIYVVPINYSDSFNMVVVSHRQYLTSLKPIELDRTRYNVEYSGKITGVSKFGIFIEFNSDNDITKPFVLTGLIPTSEMDDNTLKEFNDRKYKAGDVLKFFVKNIVNENKIILTKFYIDWKKTFEDYQSDREVNCTVIKIQDNENSKQGNIIFATIDDTKLVGTITNFDKKCQIGDIIKLKISKIDKQNKRIFLKA